LIALLVMGFGMGQLMSSINLLVGAAPASVRSRALANVNAAWCIGAVLSPVLSTVLLPAVSPALRLILFSAFFLLPLFSKRLENFEPSAPEVKPGWRAYASGGALVFILIFLVYGGIEASISAWLPEFANRFSGSALSKAEWSLSLFWMGLIAGRYATAAVAVHVRESIILRVAIICSLVLLLCLLALPSLVPLAAWSVVMGTVMGPLFPLFLSHALSSSYPTRVMGGILAACALGSAVFPLLLGVLSSLFTLRIGMLLPVACLCLLLIFLEDSPRHVEVHP